MNYIEKELNSHERQSKSLVYIFYHLNPSLSLNETEKKNMILSVVIC